MKANRTLASVLRVANGEPVTVKAVRPDGAIQLDDGRLLDPGYREFSTGDAATIRGSQGKTVDSVLFSDWTIKAATNAQQCYVTISRSRRGIRIFTPDKEQLRRNVSRSGHRPLALDVVPGLVNTPARRLWDALRRQLLRVGPQAADRLYRVKQLRPRLNSTLHGMNTTKPPECRAHSGRLGSPWPRSVPVEVVAGDQALDLRRKDLPAAIKEAGHDAR